MRRAAPRLDRRGRRWIAGPFGLLVATLLLAAGCAAPGPADYAELNARVDARLEPTTPHLESDAIIMSDGARLPLRVWLPSGPVKAVVLALHGFNDYSNAFATPGEALAWRGIATYAYDQRGFGKAPLR